MKIPTILFGIFLIFLPACSNQENTIANNWLIKKKYINFNDILIDVASFEDGDFWTFNHDGSYMQTEHISHFGTINYVGKWTLLGNTLNLTPKDSTHSTRYEILKLNKSHLELDEYNSMNELKGRIIFIKMEQ